MPDEHAQHPLHQSGFWVSCTWHRSGRLVRGGSCARCVAAATARRVEPVGLGDTLDLRNGLPHAAAFHQYPLRRPRLATAQSWLAIGGVALVAVGWIGAVGALPGTQSLLVGGALL